MCYNTAESIADLGTTQSRIFSPRIHLSYLDVIRIFKEGFSGVDKCFPTRGTHGLNVPDLGALPPLCPIHTPAVGIDALWSITAASAFSDLLGNCQFMSNLLMLQWVAARFWWSLHSALPAACFFPTLWALHPKLVLTKDHKDTGPMGS